MTVQKHNFEPMISLTNDIIRQSSLNAGNLDCRIESETVKGSSLYSPAQAQAAGTQPVSQVRPFDRSVSPWGKHRPPRCTNTEAEVKKSRSTRAAVCAVVDLAYSTLATCAETIAKSVCTERLVLNWSRHLRYRDSGRVRCQLFYCRPSTGG